MDEELKRLAEAPGCKNPTKLNLPKGRLPAKREEGRYIDPKERAEIKARRERDHTAKQDALLDYYATTDVPAERVAQHVGFYQLVLTKPMEELQEGEKPQHVRVLDVERAAAALEWRRKHPKP